MQRREFVKLTGAALCAGVCGCAADGGHKAWTGPTSFDVGTAADFPNDGLYAQWAQRGGFFLVREKGRLYTVSSICSHKDCGLSVKGTELICDCHGSRFTPQGTVLTGPATRSLEHFGISTSASGRIMVDRTKAYPEGQWQAAGAFVAV